MEQKQRATNSLRIIGGSHRGRKIRFPDAKDLRPTPDRVRETLFNWLQGDLPGSRCLDLFAGSGALGIEALSRGAASVTFVEVDRSASQSIKNNLDTLGLDQGTVFHADANKWLALQSDETGVYDVVFLDPPFSDSDPYRLCNLLLNGNLLADPFILYIESGTLLDPSLMPRGWNVSKHKKAGQVHYYLVTGK